MEACAWSILHKYDEADRVSSQPLVWPSTQPGFLVVHGSLNVLQYRGWPGLACACEIDVSAVDMSTTAAAAVVIVFRLNSKLTVQSRIICPSRLLRSRPRSTADGGGRFRYWHVACLTTMREIIADLLFKLWTCVLPGARLVRRCTPPCGRFPVRQLSRRPIFILHKDV